jgi:DNA repair protein RadD
MLRDYQTRAITQLYDWFRANDGNPCLVLPTGAGKSHIVAALCKDAVQNYPETKILMMSHVKELIEQNAQKMRQHWANAPLGIYSASIGKKQFDSITFAGIQSVRNKADQIGHIDLCIIDECHLVSHKDEGSYRHMINDLKVINPQMRVVGLTATPYRLGHGLITEGDAIFDDIIEPVSIQELIYKGYLARLESKATELQYDLSRVKKRGGEYLDSDLQKAVDQKEINLTVVEEIIALAGDRKAWLCFCTGIDHARHIAIALNDLGVPAACVTGDTPKAERERLLNEFKAGNIRALTNANVLTTGFDYPDIDLIAMLRPTMSPSLYVQMAGRGMRPKSHTDHCLVLDFAGVVQTHGPIVNVRIPTKDKEGDGEPPVRVCPECHEICHASVKKCPACGYLFPPPPKKTLALHGDDIMGENIGAMGVTSWSWRIHNSKASGKPILAVSYYGALNEKPVVEYLTINYPGYAGEKALTKLKDMMSKSCVNKTLTQLSSLDDVVLEMNHGMPPKKIMFRKSGNFQDVTYREW